jgi:hypothetical protein
MRNTESNMGIKNLASVPLQTLYHSKADQSSQEQ